MSSLCNCSAPESIKEKLLINNTAPTVSTSNIVTTVTISSSPPDEKLEQIESNDIKNEKEISSIKNDNVNASSETVDDTKTNNLVLCRICEEMILAENLGEHSKVCAVIQEQEMRLYDSTQKLKKLYNEFKIIKSFMVIIYIYLMNIS